MGEEANVVDALAHILLRVLAEKTTVNGDPIVVFDLQEATGLTRDQLKAAWRVLNDQALIDAYPSVFAGRINPRGKAALAAVAAVNEGAIDKIDYVSLGQQALLDALASDYADSPGGVIASRFLSRHEDHLSDIDELDASSVRCGRSALHPDEFVHRHDVVR